MFGDLAAGKLGQPVRCRLLCVVGGAVVGVRGPFSRETGTVRRSRRAHPDVLTEFEVFLAWP